MYSYEQGTKGHEGRERSDIADQRVALAERRLFERGCDVDLVVRLEAVAADLLEAWVGLGCRAIEVATIYGGQPTHELFNARLAIAWSSSRRP